MLPALPTGSTCTSGASPRKSTISKARGLLALEPHRVHRVHQRDRVVVGQPAGEPQAVVEVAADHDHLGAVHDRLGELAGRDLALRHQHQRLDPGPGGVRRHRRGGVAGRGADHRLGALADGDGERDGHAAVLERAGRVVALDLEPDLARRCSSESHAAVDQRGAALAQGDRRGAVGDVAARSRYSSITPRHWCAPARWWLIRASPSTRITEDTSRTKSMAAQVPRRSRPARRRWRGARPRRAARRRRGPPGARSGWTRRARRTPCATAASTPARSSTSSATW